MRDVSQGLLALLLPLEPDILKGRARMQGDRVDGVLRYPWTYACEAPQIHDRSKHDALDGQVLHMMQERFPFGAVALLPLLLEELILWLLQAHLFQGSCPGIGLDQP